MKLARLAVLPIFFVMSVLSLYVYFFHAGDGSKAYLTIIDDDTRIETYTYWKRLSDETGVKITIAAVPNWVDGNGPAGKATMSLAQLKEMYDNGHDVVSHGFDTITIQEYLDEPDVIHQQLHNSRQWLIDNGMTRNKGFNYFVWPQGLTGDSKTQELANIIILQ